jgi:L-lactate dehydrogenase (cytochrome)
VKLASVLDYRTLARRKLPKFLFDYIDGGSYAESTLAANVADLDAIKLRQRVMRDVSRLSTGIELFGQSLSMPLVLAPVGIAGLYARRGEVQAARAAQAAGIGAALSTVGICTMEEVAAAARPPWFQLYMARDRDFMDDVLRRARAVECPVLFFTVDLPVGGARYRDTRNGMTATDPVSKTLQAFDVLAHPHWLWDVYLRGAPATLGNVAASAGGARLRSIGDFWAWVGANFDPRLTWDDIAWIRERWPGPLVLKGVLDADDAREAVARGVDGIVVSNHGGRQLDGAASSIAALPRIAEAVGDQLPIIMDGGVRSGLDVLKALSLGAKACLIGRPWAWALGAAGQKGVAGVLEIMRRELYVAMALTGCTDVREAGPHLLDR